MTDYTPTPDEQRVMLDYTEQARELLRRQLAQHHDEGVRTINAFAGPSEESVKRVAAALEARDRRNAQ